MKWFYVLLFGVFVFLVLPMDGVMRLVVAAVVTAATYALAYATNGPRRSGR